MKVDVLLGLQWGDEGKGKIVDVLTPKYNIIARFQGGPNAGHTLEFDNKKFVLHTIPSGIFRKEAINIIGNGVVLDPVIFMKEITALQNYIQQNLFISKKAHIILPTHRLLDATYEKAKGAQKIGSTLKGIGPTYTDKISRNGLRIGDILDKNFNDKYQTLKNKHLEIIGHHNFNINEHLVDGDSYENYEQKWFQAIDAIKKMQLIESEYFINDKLNTNQSILAEGAQGSLLDIDFGTYPFVTSSNTLTSGACTGLGISPSKIGEVIGIFKAYTTRVGSGPFPTELNDADGETMRVVGHEFGSTTGRPRRCGWLDLVALKYTNMLNGVTQLIMMKADVLSPFKSIKICTGYKINGEITTHFPYSIDDNTVIEPIYKEFKGWEKDLTNVKSIKDLPSELMEYIKFIEKETGIPIKIVSVGPDRTQTLMF